MDDFKHLPGNVSWVWLIIIVILLCLYHNSAKFLKVVNFTDSVII